MISFPCSHCRQPLRVKDDLAGKKGKCPHCGHALLVPATVPGGSSHDDATLLPTAAPAFSVGRPGTASFDTQGSSADGSHSPAAPAPGEAVSILAPPQQPGELGRLGPYRVLKVLGQGGMGVVYKAEDPHLERLVALKAMLPGFSASTEARQRFLREAKAAAAVKHDHVVTIYQVGEDRGVPFLAMEFLEGEPLDRRLQKESKMPIPELLRIGREVAEGLAAAHERGLIHRDIKPANIWLERRDEGGGMRDERKNPLVSSLIPHPSSLTRVKILDFGLARGGGKGQEQLTQTGAIMGTPAFMAPEQARGETVDARCDLFSLGCMLYRMCAGELPFKGNDPISTLMSVATVNPPSVQTLNAAVPPALARLVNRLLAKDPARRPASARVVAEELAALEKSAVAEAPTAVVPPIPTRSNKESASPRRKKSAEPPSRRARRAAPAWLPFALIGGVVALIGVGILAVQLIIRIKNKDGTETTVVAPKGSTVEVEKDGKGIGRFPGALAGQGWVQLFNGKDLKGWKVFPRGEGNWRVEDGALTCSGPRSHLFSERGDWENFHFRVEAKINARGNSGQFFRTDFGPGFPKGYEAQIALPGGDPRYFTGSLIGFARVREILHDPDDWFTQEVIANADHIVIKVNDKTVVDERTGMYRKGHFALQHLNPNTSVYFRKVEVKELPPGNP